MSTLYNRKARHIQRREVYDCGARPWGGRRRRDKDGRMYGLNRQAASREREARQRLKRHRRARWQRVLGRVRQEGGVWARLRGWITERHHAQHGE